MATTNQNHNDVFSKQWTNLAEERLGTQVFYATDDFFAEKEKLIRPGRGIFIEDKYTENGKWMDGWESRRKRTPGHDYCLIKLGASGRIKAFDIDTNHFLGNHPPFASVEACYLEENHSNDDFIALDKAGKIQWHEVLEKSSLEPGSQNLFELKEESKIFTHLKLNIYPDGGVARFRVYGDVEVNWQDKKNQLTDLAFVKNGGKAIACNDMFFSNMDNINAPGRGVNMGDGWETKRRREPGNDWLILKLGHPGSIEQIELDTAHFKGNYPDSFSLEGIKTDETDPDKIKSENWQEFLPKTKLEMDKQHYITIPPTEVFGHVRLNIFPDGGVSRIRLIGKAI